MQHVRHRVFILLSHTLNASEWKQRYENGTIPDWSPYGYGYAERRGYSLVYSRSGADSPLLRLVDAVAKVFLGFKIVHAIRNWRACSDRAVSVIWTHTEREFLPLLFLSWCFRRPLAPVIAQSVWLIDEWERMWIVQRIIARMLMKRASLCTFLSPVNALRAEQLGLGHSRRIVAFGVSSDSFPVTRPRCRRIGDAIRVFAVGNDRHRDWATFVQAFCHDPQFEIFAATRNFPLASTGLNWTARQCNLGEIVEHYRWADVVVIPLRENSHASGITSVLEATFLGRPVVVTDTGGLDWYFSGAELHFCSVGDPIALRNAVQMVAREPERTMKKVRSAQATILQKDLSSNGFAMRHVRMTEELVGKADELRILRTGAEVASAGGWTDRATN